MTARISTCSDIGTIQHPNVRVLERLGQIDQKLDNMAVQISGIQRGLNAIREAVMAAADGGDKGKGAS